MMKKYILFDLDGTLTDPKTGITKSVQYSLSHFGIKTDNLDDLIPFIGPPLKESFIEFCAMSDKDADTAVNKYREYFSEKGIYENSVFPGTDDLLKTLKDQGRTLITATSKPEIYAKEILSNFSIDKYFSFTAGSMPDGSRSDKKEVISYALKNCSIDKLADAVMVGDRKYDIIGAEACGIESIGVCYGYGSRDELSAAGASYIVSDIAELKQMLCSDR